MSAIYQSFDFIQGQDIDLVITVKDSDDVVVNLTGGSVRFVMARSSSASTLDIDSAASPQTATVALTTPTSGILTVSLADTITDNLSGQYYYECKFTSSAGLEAVVTRGFINVESSLT